MEDIIWGEPSYRDVLGIYIAHTDQTNCVEESNIDNIITAKRYVPCTLWYPRCSGGYEMKLSIVGSSTEGSVLRGTTSPRFRQEEIVK